MSDINSRRIKPGVDCIVDPTLPDSVHGQRVFLASNLHNNEDLLPHYILQLLQLIVSLPIGSSYVSIYESGSTDQTGGNLQRLMSLRCMPSAEHGMFLHLRQVAESSHLCAAQWLDVLQHLLQILEVPNTVVTGGRCLVSQFAMLLNEFPTSACFSMSCPPFTGV